MTWYGILLICIFSAIGALVAAWLEDNVFSVSNKCDKCKHINGENSEKE